MMYNNYNGFQFGQGMMGGWLPFLGGGFLLLMLWSIVWKGLALWHSSQRKEPWWFVALLVINTAGILEIIYLFAVAKLKFSELFPTTSKDAPAPENKPQA